MLKLTSDLNGNHVISLTSSASNTNQQDLQLLISNLKSVRDESGIKLFYLFFLTSFDMKLLKIEIVMIRIEKLFVQ